MTVRLGRSNIFPLRLVFIAGQLCLGGAEQQLYRLLASLDRSRYVPFVISLGVTPNEYWAKPIADLDIPVQHLARSIRLMRVVRITKMLRTLKAQLVHGWVLHTNPYSALAGALAEVPVRVGSLRGNYQGMPRNKLVRWLGYRGLDALVTNSFVVSREIHDLRLTRARVATIPNGIVLPNRPLETERERLKVGLGCAPTDLLIGTIGRTDHNKNHIMLLRAFTRLAHAWPRLRLVIIGDGPLSNQLRLTAKNLGLINRVVFPGQVAHAARFLAAMELFCLTSYTEGMPNVVMEASAAGLPVVATVCGGSTELVEENITGFLVDVDDDAAMSSKIEWLLRHPNERLRMGEAGRYKMSTEFGSETMAARMMGLYEELVTQKLAN